MAYTTDQLNTIIATLESSLAKGYAEVVHEGHRMVYRTVTDIRTAIAYFKALLNNATDAPAQTPAVRTYFLYGGKGIGI